MSKTALITGASRGIGAVTAKLAAAQGWDVAVNYAESSKAAEAVCAAVRAQGQKAVAVKADVADPAQVAAMFEACEAALGPPELLVNNAGIIGKASRLAELPLEALRRTIDVNLCGTIYCSQEAIARMSTNKGGNGGVIVNISSIAAVLGSPGEYVHYAATKGAVETLTIGMGRELGVEGIRAVCIRAGTVDTEIHARSGNPDRPKMVAQMSPLARVGQPEDIAEAILWLASDKAAYVTGAIIPVSGGL
ncbi:MAG: SDR family oxidoreductase [Pseudomonadota bacterium]